MSLPLVSAVEESDAKRWREWQMNNEYSQRQGAQRARVAFTLIFVALGIWFVLQLLS